MMDVASKVKFKFCVASENDAQLIFALHRGPKLSELADPRWIGKWSKCANEGGVCKCNGKVRFGARAGPPVWKIMNYSASVRFVMCTAEGFGGDPAPETAPGAKRCECENTFRAEWTPCAQEGAKCTCPNTAGRARFGGAAAGFYESKEVHGSIQCSSEVFGDPIAGTVKSCDCFTTELK